jgi:hypothetical protein
MISIEEIVARMPEIDDFNPCAKYHLFAKLNELTEEQKKENNDRIESIMMREKVFNEQWINKCVIESNTALPEKV